MSTKIPHRAIKTPHQTDTQNLMKTHKNSQKCRFSLIVKPQKIGFCTQQKKHQNWHSKLCQIRLLA
jgi:hypothetical protein